jgi:hypothetical protein
LDRRGFHPRGKHGWHGHKKSTFEALFFMVRPAGRTIKKAGLDARLFSTRNWLDQAA